MAGINDQPLYNAPAAPAENGNPVADVVQAWEWWRDFCNTRGFVMVLLTDVVINRSSTIF